MTTSNTPASWTSRTIYLEANPWRVLRRLLNSETQPMTFAALRPWQRRDKDLAMIARLVDLGLIEIVGTQDDEPTYKITAKGAEAADLGEVRIDPTPTPDPAPTAKPIKKGKKK
ncbi:MAG: hypothetical protein LC104_10745 [Bacteroidales bacterium]|nr:hypothetical protein [Bacteroidales bacterium]